MRRIYLVSTVGASLLNNYERVRGVKIDLENVGLYDELVDELVGYIGEKGRESSAEVNSIDRIFERLRSEGIDLGAVHLYFLVSDTKEGMLCGEALKRYYMDLGFTVTVEVIVGLKYDAKKFMDEGLVELVNKLSEIVVSGRREGVRVIINATAGFKPESAYATLVGILNKCEIYYIHEKFRELVELPPIPISIKHEIKEKYLDVLKYLARKRKIEDVVSKYSEEVLREIKTLTIRFKDNGGEYIMLGPAGKAFILAVMGED